MKIAIADPDPAGRLLSYYLSERSKASFQGSGDLRKRVRNAIGISQSVIPDSRLTALDPFFLARNSIAHSMDYANVHESLSTKRNHRTVEDASALCELAFDVAADLMHAAADVILAAR